MFVAFDIWSHEQDIRAAVGLRGEREDERVNYLIGNALETFSRRFAEAGSPALRVLGSSVERVLGEGEPTATIHADDYELLRLLFGRRSLAQIERADWDGAAAPFVPHLHLFDLPVADLVD